MNNEITALRAACAKLAKENEQLKEQLAKAQAENQKLRAEQGQATNGRKTGRPQASETQRRAELERQKRALVEAEKNVTQAQAGKVTGSSGVDYRGKRTYTSQPEKEADIERLQNIADKIKARIKELEESLLPGSRRE